MRLDELRETLREFVVLIEKRIREADISGGERVKFGSTKHIKDLEKRIAELTTWRDKYKRGSDKRADYSRIISKLKNELAAAKRKASVKK